MARPTGRFRSFYGAHPLHLLVMVACLSVLAYVVVHLGGTTLWNRDTWWQSIAVWFLGAVVAHDLVLFPLYAAADRLLTSRLDRRKARRWSVVNHVRLPLLVVAVVTGLFYPGIARQGRTTYAKATGQTQEPFLGRWLVLVAVVCLLSAVVLAARLLAARRAHRSVPEPSGGSGGDGGTG